VLVAVATEGRRRVNQHFGHATEFQIFEVSARRRCSSATAAWTCTARAATARTSNCPPSSSDQRLPRGAGGQDRRLPARRAGAAGIEPVERYAHEFIEKAALPGSTTTAAASPAARSSTGSRRRGDPAGRVHRQRGGVTRASSGSHPQQERHHVPEDHRFHLHRLLGLRTGVPQRRHPRKGGVFAIDPKKCTECEGHFDSPQCVAVCPVDGCIVPA
jgi:ferredoxin